MKRVLWPIAAAAGILLLVLWQTGWFQPKIPAGAPSPRMDTAPHGRTVPVERIAVPLVEEAVGSVQSRHRVDISPRIQATILQIAVNAGTKVNAGDLLVRLDPRDLDAKVGQAEQAVNAATANLKQAQSDFQRTKELVARQVASVQEGENARLRLDVTSASLGEARRALEQARVARSYAEIRAPVTAVVIEKNQNAGDMAIPGQPILQLFDPKILRLEAPVRETVARRLRVGDVLDVRLGTDETLTTGLVDEIVPQADPVSRSFLVKVLVPSAENLYAGMYGRLLIRTGSEDVTVIPQQTVERVGQLEYVTAVTSQGAERRFVQTGRKLGGKVEVLAGLAPGEDVSDAGK